MLSFNVAGLLRSAPGTTRTYPVAVPELSVADDLELVGPIEGHLRLSRTGRSILCRGELVTRVSEPCSRCLAQVQAPITIEIEEEALPSIDIVTGVPLDIGAEPDALRLDEHHELDLGEAVREAISLAEPIAPLCRPDCRGLCLVCGADRNEDPRHEHPDDEIDPRLAALADIRDRLQR